LVLKCLFFQLKKQHEIETYILFDYNLHTATDSLLTLAAYEDWGNDRWILNNFVDQTFLRQMKQDNLHKIPETNYYCCNMNLLDTLSNPIFLLLEKQPEDRLYRYSFIKFCTAEEVKRLFPKNIKISSDELESMFHRPTWFTDITEIFF